MLWAKEAPCPRPCRLGSLKLLMTQRVQCLGSSAMRWRHPRSSAEVLHVSGFLWRFFNACASWSPPSWQPTRCRYSSVRPTRNRAGTPLVTKSSTDIYSGSPARYARIVCSTASFVLVGCPSQLLAWRLCRKAGMVTV